MFYLNSMRTHNEEYQLAQYIDLSERHKAKFILTITRKNMITQTNLISTPIGDLTNYNTVSVNLNSDVLKNDV
jgi:hypothetical protein